MELSPLKRIEGHDCFEHATSPRPPYFKCGKCKVTWWKRNPICWEILDMECSCGALGWSEDTSIEWYSDTECHRCHAERTEGAA